MQKPETRSAPHWPRRGSSSWKISARSPDQTGGGGPPRPRLRRAIAAITTIAPTKMIPTHSPISKIPPMSPHAPRGMRKNPNSASVRIFPVIPHLAARDKGRQAIRVLGKQGGAGEAGAPRRCFLRSPCSLRSPCCRERKNSRSVNRQPVIHLQGKEIIPRRPQGIEDIRRLNRLTEEITRAAVLLPYGEQCAARAPFPAQHEVAAERADIEVEVLEGERG